MLYGPGIPCLDPDKPLTRSEWENERREDICPHCDRELEGSTELRTGLCNSDDCPRHDDPDHIE
jgi:hypothetical protein